MADKVCTTSTETSFAGSSTGTVREAVCVHTRKITDACKDRDCLEDLRVYFSEEDQTLVDSASSVKAKTAELLYVYIDVESLPFNRGFYTVEVQFYYKITVDVYIAGVSRPTTITGLSTFSKRVLLFGSEGSARIFSSKTTLGDMDCQRMMKTAMPEAFVEAVDPILLDARVADACAESTGCGCSCGCGCCTDCDIGELPSCVCCCFQDPLADTCKSKKVLVTLGQFSMIRLERDTQLLIPSYDYCIPNKECTALSGESAGDPCTVFENIAFPTEEFFPPAVCDINDCSTGTVAGVTVTKPCTCTCCNK